MAEHADEAALQPQAEVQQVTTNIKIPEFWPRDPQLWFAQLDAQFELRHVTSQRTKFNYVAGSLKPDIATEVRDLLLNRPDEAPYDVLKAALISRVSQTEQARLQQLLIKEELGDNKPSQLLRRLQQLLGDNHMDLALLRELFLQRLPQNLRLVLAASPPTISLADLATMADKMVEVAPLNLSVSAVPRPDKLDAPNLHHINDALEHMQSQINALTDRDSRKASRESDRSVSRSRRYSPSPTRSYAPVETCWYHSRFGAKARKCHGEGCRFAPNRGPR